MAGEGLIALGIELLLPVAKERFTDAEALSRFGKRVALNRDELHGREFEVAGIVASRSRHDGSPLSEFTLLSGCPPFVGRFTPTSRTSTSTAFPFPTFFFAVSRLSVVWSAELANPGSMHTTAATAITNRFIESSTSGNKDGHRDSAIHLDGSASG